MAMPVGALPARFMQMLLLQTHPSPGFSSS
jgi:hypothetical protein